MASEFDIHPRGIRIRGVRGKQVESSCEAVGELLSDAADEQTNDMIARDESTNQ